MPQDNSRDLISLPGFNPLSLPTYVPTYQLWCGPSWSAGQRVSGPLTPEQKKVKPGEITLPDGSRIPSQVDTACKAHDERYSDAMGQPDEAYQILQADLILMRDVSNFDWSLMSPTEKTYASLLTTSFALKIAAVDTPSSAFEALKNEAASLTSTIFSQSEFRNEFQLTNPFVDGFGSSMSGGFDNNGNIILNFSKTLTDGTDASGGSKTLNATFLGQDVDSMFNTDLNFSLKPKLSVIETDSSGNQTIASLSYYEGDKTVQLANSGLIATDATYVDDSGNPVSSYSSLFKTEDSDGNVFTFIRDDVYAPIKDGTVAAVSSVLNAIDSATTSLISFINHQIEGIFEPIFKELFSTDDSTKDANGDTAAQRLAGKILADILEGKDITQIANDTTSQVLIQNLLKDASAKLAAAIPTGPLGADTAAFVQGTIAGAVINFAIAIAADHRMDSDEYGTAAAKALTSAALYNHFGGGAQGVAAVAAVMSLYDSFKADHSMNGDQYADAATSAAAAAASAYAGHALGEFLATALSEFGPIGVVGGYAIGYLIGYLLYNPVKNNLDSKWDGVKEIYDGLEDLIIHGEITSGDGLEENFKQILRGIDDFVISSSGRFVRDFGIGAYNLFGGHYGQTYKPGQYPTPYASINISPKADGTGNIIQGLDPQGVVAIAREYYHDDIYGTRGSDNLIGKSGTNTVAGYEGNDHIEGRGDVDLLIGGAGDDEVFGGNGDDQIYGSEGSDNLFGGNGNDIIIGGTGASISGNGSLEDGNDFIQGGNGDDQIMGEAGNDQIQGNAGNDTILGGTGNDRIEGNEGDDSILSEDGDDMILGGAGSDIIDGGAGADYIEGNEGNDNIRGGDGNDEILGQAGVDIIYGDAGNDLINTGSENDLAFGGLGNDIIYGAAGDDTLSGELGNDYIIGADGADTIDGGAGDDILFGGIGNDTITTGEGNDTIIYRIGDGNDTIIETDTAGNDVLRLSEINSKLSNNTTNKLVLTKSGNDLLIQIKDDLNSIIAGNGITVKNQFAGTEILKKIEFADGKSIDLTSVAINGDNSISYTTSTYTNIDTSIQEELSLGYNDMMQIQDEQINPSSTYSATNYNNSGEQDQIDYEKYNEMEWRSKKEKRSIFGGHYTVWYKYYEQNVGGTNGNDRLVGHWWSENVYGGNGDDQLHGGDGDDNLLGGAGNDILHGGAGNDRAYGEAGQDLIYGGSGNDYLDGGTDNDAVYANEGSDTIVGNAGDDYLEGNGGNDSITDNEGNNIIIGGAGIDTITTGSGNDKIEGNDDADQINAGDGNNLIYGNGGNDFITSGSGNDSIYGQEGSELINAGAGDDYISGGAGDDVLNGQDGNDTIFGDIGIDQISGGTGVDYIYGGSGADILKGDAGNDQVKGGDSDDWIEGGADNDKLYGESGSDKIYGDSGNDEIFGGLNGDVIEGGAGNDVLSGGSGNDILVDGEGSDTLDGGTDSDIIILTKENSASTSIDAIKNWNKNEDKIILKVNYQNPITFADIQSGMVQNGANVEIALDNGQKITIENVTTSDITSSNFQIGLSGGANNDILFGTNGEDIIFGDEGNDKIYGGDGNDELWGGKGSDELYGEGGDDILRYEVDGKYTETKQVTYWDEEAFFDYPYMYDDEGYPGEYRPGSILNQYSPLVGSVTENNVNATDDVAITRYTLLNKSLVSAIRYMFTLNGLYYDYDNGPPLQVQYSQTLPTYTRDGFRSVNETPQYLLSNQGVINTKWYGLYDWFYAWTGATKIEYSYSSTPTFATKNFLNSQLTEITGYNRTFDKFIGGDGVNTILMTDGNDVLALDDPTSTSGSETAGTATSARVQDISVIHAGSGDDVINFSTQKYSYGNSVVYGGTGNDKIWMSSGNDQIFGQEGNDEIYSGAGNDTANGGTGDDVIYAGTGNDSIEGGSGTNQLFGEDGDDTFIAGSGADTINGGNGSDTISYVNSTSAVIVNLATNTLSGGDAANDLVSSIENLTGSAFDDTLTGNSSANIINGGSGNDTMTGSTGSDTYTYNSNSGIDTITESGSDLDYIQFSVGISASDLIFTINGNDLQIQIGASASNKLILKDQLLGINRIEYLKFNDGSQIGTLSVPSVQSVDQNLVVISEKFFIASEDQQLTISNPLNESQGERRRFESLTALYGTLAFDELLNQFAYKGNSNFHGIDEITLIEEGGVQNRFTVFVNGVNDAPTFTNLGDVPNKEVKVEEEFSVNLKDYFADADGDKLALSLKLQGFDALPDWINFNSESGIVSGKIGRDGKLNFTATATDPSGASLSDAFRISIARNIADDIIPTTPIAVITGTDAADTLTATPNSSDIISGGAGDDVINYTKDNDWIESSNGSYYTAWNTYSGDTIAVTGKQRSFDAFDGGDGYDKLNLTDQNDVIFLDDAIVSNVGDIAKLSSIEEIDAGDGDDVIDLTSLTFTYEDAILNGGNGNDVLWGNDGDDTINGDAGDDNLQGGKGNDTINGGTGNDIIKGYDGNDQIKGGAGFDVMIGGDGNDQFIFTDKSDSIGSFSNLSETDIISDFVQNTDKINLSALGFDSIIQGQGSNLSATGLEFYFKDGYTIIDDPNSNFAIKLAGEIQLGASDFNF